MNQDIVTPEIIIAVLAVLLLASLVGPTNQKDDK